MKKSLIIGIILVIGGIGLAIYSEYIKNANNIHDIVESQTKEDGKSTYLDATYIGGTITNKESNSYYVIFGNGFQYIVYMRDKEAYKINKYLLDNPESEKRIYGVTKKIPKELVEKGIKFANTWLDNNHTHEEDGEDHHTHNITEEEFYEYFGYVYMDSTIKSNVVIDILTYVFSIIGLLIIFSYINKKYHLM